MKSSVHRRNGNGPWVMSTQVNGKRYFATLGEGSKRWAQREGDLELQRQLEADLKVKPARTVKGLINAWRKYGNSGQSKRGKLKEATVKANESAFLDICRLGGGLTKESWLEDVTPAVVRAWHAAKLAEPSDLEESRRLASLSSKWTQAKSVFGKRALLYYRDLGLNDLQQWAEEMREVQLPKGRVPTYEMPPAELIKRTEELGAKLRKENKWLWVIYSLEINCGLRAGEIAALRKEWVREVRGVLVIDLNEKPGWRPKGTERMVPIDPKLWEEIKTVSKDYETVLPGNHSARYEMITKKFAEWMTEVGWSGKKKGHELRRLFGSRVYTEFGPAWAKEYLGHASVDTTTRFYAKLDKPYKLLPTR